MRLPPARPLAAALLAAHLLAPPGPARAEAARAPAIAELSLCYELALGRVPFGALTFSQARGSIAAEGYHLDLFAESLDKFDRYARFRYEATSDGRLAHGAEPVPERYEARAGVWPRHRRVELRFDRDTGAIDAETWPPRDAGRVPPEARRGALDPLAAVIRARSALWRLRAGGALGPAASVRVPVFDGRRRYDVELWIAGERALPAIGRPEPMVHAQARVVPIAGFGERRPLALPQGPVDVYLSDDRDFLPLYIDTGLAQVLLVGKATGGRRCDG